MLGDCKECILSINYPSTAIPWKIANVLVEIRSKEKSRSCLLVLGGFPKAQIRPLMF